MKAGFYLLFVLLFHLSKHNYAQYQDALANYLIDDSDISVANYNLIKTVNNQSFTVYTLNVTSLKWFNATFSSSPIWWHTVYVTVPKNINFTQSSFFFMNSGTNAPYSEGKYQSLLSTLSVSCQCVTVNMHQVPNQPIVFFNDPSQKSKTEDEIVAYTFNEWVKNRQNYPGNSSNSLPLLFPMVKSVKRTMDLVLQFLTSVNTATNGKFIASGVSKRGWTSLLTTAVDSRVIANIPVVYDNININPCTHAHYQSFGGAYSFALQDYYLQNVTLNVDEISYYYLGQLIDPYAYFTKYQNKQFMFVTSSLDEFMMPWNTHYFWRDLNIQTNNKAFLRRLPNTDHYLPGQDQQLAATFSNFIKLQSLNAPNKWPLVQWDFSNNATHGVIDVTISNLVLFNSFQVTGIYAYSNSTKRKDFRMYTLSPTGLALQPIKWQNKVVAMQTNATSLSSSTGSLKYKYAIQRDATFTRYTAFYVQIAFNMNSSPLTSQVSESQLFTVTTETNIIPEFNPVGDCHGSDCLGYLV